MPNINLLPKVSIGKNFIPSAYLPAGKDEYYLRNEQSGRSPDSWHHCTADEIDALKRNNNRADNWDTVLVSDDFNPGLIRDSAFFGLVRIGALRDGVLEHKELRLPIGITGSRIISCDIGDDVAIHNVHYLAHYIVGNRCMLSAINGMLTTSCAKFGNGILKVGESEDARVWMELMNECGGRMVLAWSGMLPADAYLWAKYRDDAALQNKLKEITQKSAEPRRGVYGTIGEQCVIINSGTLTDVRIGDHCTISGADAIRNVTINSFADEQTRIGQGVELADGIVGSGCAVLSGARAERFVLGDHANLKYNALLLDSYLGENSTISCCEVRNSLIFPSHEQHHNNSFLIASLLMGQSNIAAGATIGSNHNSRSNDLEVAAGRGFWPGLCASVKHSSRFASFVLLAKGDYPCEIDIPLPFTLVNNNPHENRLEVAPAFWWLNNMYALARTSSKFRERDKRKIKSQHIEFDFLAPDTVEEIKRARRLLEIWTAKASLRNKKGRKPDALKENDIIGIGRKLLLGNKKAVQSLEIIGETMEKSKRTVMILNAADGYEAYGEMLHYYAVKNCLEYLRNNADANLASLCKALQGKREREWTNLGGQLVPMPEVEKLRADIGSGTLNSWDDIHKRYDALWEAYLLAKQRHAFAVLCDLVGATTPTKKPWLSALDKAVKIQECIRDRVFASRKKDDDNPFRQATFRNVAEMKATVGIAAENRFVKQVQKETEAFALTVKAIKRRG